MLASHTHYSQPFSLIVNISYCNGVPFIDLLSTVHNFFFTGFHKSYSYLAPAVWNGLALDLRFVPTIHAFKCLLKTFIFTHIVRGE